MNIKDLEKKYFAINPLTILGLFFAVYILGFGFGFASLYFYGDDSLLLLGILFVLILGIFDMIWAIFSNKRKKAMEDEE